MSILNIDPAEAVRLISEGAKLAGKDSPAFQTLAGFIADRLDARAKAQVDNILATARGERKAAHAGLQAGAKGGRR